MRIALITTSYPCHEDDPSGHFIRAEAKELARKGHCITVFSPLQEIKQADDGIRVLALGGGNAFGWPGASIRLQAFPWYTVDAIAWMQRVRRALKYHSPHRIIAHWALPCGWPIGFIIPSPLELVSHGADVRLLCSLPIPMRVWLVRRLLGRALCWRFVSVKLREQLLDSLPPYLARLLEHGSTITPPSLELPNVQQQILHRRRQLQGWKVYTAVGRLIPSKRLDRTITYTSALPSHPEKGNLLTIIGDGPERKRLESMAKRLQINTYFTGKIGRREALAWIGASQALLYASQQEGLSTVLREAQMLGTPIIYC
ncbi:glycosyltransferase family 4 protein [Pajaroellobacter abortibovis]|uniref:Glycosyl transferase family 1 domain-containing protein n=1 Tax=Pajaroellobacter abortibovis TaxID=1882918 RepID=A0A1L6MVW5_9BACT|nr:glycosyltransferase family 4 protein [Pajaroellobacter abortibovis]APR99690.1 hypothetical protein BCY86_02625 [Pajaroellobacter abortibovis]